MDERTSEENAQLRSNSELHESTAKPDENDTSPPRGNPFPIVGIGASAGGIDAFKKLLAALSPETGMAFVLIQHLDPHHPSQLVEILQPLTDMKIETVFDGIALKPNGVFVIPPNTSMVIQDGCLRLADRPPGLHLPIDIFFRSLAEIQGSRAIGVVLSGNASDGSEGLKAIKAECGITMAQDEATATFGGMPRNAAATGVVDFVLPPGEIARELVRLSGHPYLTLPRKNTPTVELLPDGEPELKKIFALLQAATKVDFSDYKKTTIRRRIGRRMMVHRSKCLADYTAYLEEHPGELRDLYRDLLITVTYFFREPEMFEGLAKIIRQRLESNSQTRQQPIRVWVPGCATGEEVYSLAICLHEIVQDLKLSIPLQLFGTDISDTSVDRARAGVYSGSVTNEVSAERLARYFVKMDGGYQVSKAIRESCVFARQDLTKDPPFSRMDIVSCRNVLIYMNAGLQRRVFPIFHYSLNPNGLLLLGSAESIAVADELFSIVDKQQHIYSRKQAPIRVTLNLAVGRSIEDVTAEASEIQLALPEADLQKRVERVILNRYSPDSVVVNADLQILHFRGNTSSYLLPGQGEASFHLLRMAQESLQAPLRRAVQAARERRVTVREKAVYTHSGDERGDVTLEVTSITAGSSAKDLCYLIVFLRDSNGLAQPSSPAEPILPEAAQERVEQLERELGDTRQYLTSLSEDHEAYSEELRAANEEVRSSNEELQSVNEELGTTKEELQSANEELTTVNEELQNRNQELGFINSDLKNLLTAVHIPILMVDTNLRLRRFTLAAEKLLELGPIDIGRPIGHVRGRIEVPEIEELIRAVLDSLNADHREVRDQDGRWYSITIRPYRTLDDRIDGAVITFVDINPLKRALQSAEEARDYAEGMIETVREPLVVLDADLRVQHATASFFETFQVKREETLGRLFYDLGNGQWNRPRLRELIGSALFRDEPFADFEVDHEFPHIGQRSMRLNARRIPLPEGQSRIVLVAMEDLTERREQAEIRYRRLFETAKDGMLVLDPESLTIEDANPFFSDLAGYPREALIGKKAADVPRFLADNVDGTTLIRRALEEESIRYSEIALIRRDGETQWVDVLANRYQLGGRTIVQANFRDVAERRSARSALQASEDRFRRFVDSVRDYALFQVDLEGRVTTWNPGAERLLGYTEQEIIGQEVRVLFTPEDLRTDEADKELGRARETGQSTDTRWHLRKDGSTFYASGVMTAVHDDTGRIQGFAKILQDITQRTEAEEQLRKSLHQKEVLLREVHHRVKNNLQVITSLLNLQAESLQSAETTIVLEEMRTRVYSLAAIHEHLYGATDLSSIDFGQYLRRLAANLSSFYSAEARHIGVVVEAGDVNLDIAQAVPCALVVNELVMNAMKHAFPSKQPGQISISMRLEEAGYSLEVTDDGIGLPADVDLSSSSTMGLQLVSLLAEQLHASLEVNRNSGSQFTLWFPAKSSVPVPL